ncbi:L-threonylcarbamoyladenylate synthase [Pseudoalteromonas tunicata]|uniref:Threonylcarbamoyl-AMP synthase n=1 Tax=Pseudoalteromonas tunicata D2 TaxID=87626 RepID=A4CDG3_9GAMM|nr:L-threonylcarbamoyladenylate synthase [Pseudoalteromonas tunicata]ATC92879.1 L-threonylcarbamoyladenylate synthase [Pseudoalteromonas tunicata]AXT31982.1 threonylcarbamoyl-AMP synthase [Pseudoalteromonas tunicata]EAR27005.1 putative double-stranded RNA-binding protein with unique protein fold, with YrdC/RibB domain [Pseudoalteromonas tunicata D2]MDP4982809.1 L-threonylcarbamoyladenylate synthase [Pseudoalteromonas tunicata]MDP5215134.1 L-threonylcarbamoyladenylate synthase [Pseudoalteromona
MSVHDELTQCLNKLEQGGVICYPTEAVYGLGCDPDNESAVMALLAIKQRPVEKGLILIADNYAQLLPYVDDAKIPMDKRAEIFSAWPGAVTWIMPAKSTTPKWLTGKFDTIAVRVTNHSVVKQLCQQFNKPLVSTSANLTGQAPVRSLDEAKAMFTNNVAYYVAGQLGGNTKPSQIKDARTGQLFRD